DGSGERDITGVTSAQGEDVIDEMYLSPDGKWIAFAGSQEIADTLQLFVVPVSSADGSERMKIAGESGDQEVYEYFAWSPDSKRLLFAANLNSEHRMDIFVADIET